MGRGRLAAHEHGEKSHLAPMGVLARAQCRRHRLGVARGDLDVDGDDGVDLTRLQQGGGGVLELPGTSRGDQIDRVGGGGLGRQPPAQLILQPGGEGGEDEAVGLQGIGRQDSGPAGVAHHPHPSPPGDGLVGQEGADGEQLLDGVDPDHPRLVEERPHRHVR